MSVPIPSSWPRAGANNPNGCATSWPARTSSSRPDGEWYGPGRPAFPPIRQLKRSRNTPDVIRSSSHGGLAGWAGRSAGVKSSESSGHRPRSSRFARRPCLPNLNGWRQQEAPDHRNASSAATGHERSALVPLACAAEGRLQPDHGQATRSTPGAVTIIDVLFTSTSPSVASRRSRARTPRLLRESNPTTAPALSWPGLRAKDRNPGRSRGRLRSPNPPAESQQLSM
jgi:hypothetical protein